MFKAIIQFLNSNSILASISKVILVTTVSITSVTSSAYIIDSISKPDDSKNEDSFLSVNEVTNQINNEEINQEEVQTSASIKTEESSGLNGFISDVVTSASKLVEGVIGYVSGDNSVDTTTSPSRQSTTTISTSPISNEDTSTGSSRNNGTTPGLVYNDDYDDDYDEDEYEDHEEDEEDEEDEDDEHDKEDEEDDHDDEEDGEDD
jgi:hypothetical protein